MVCFFSLINNNVLRTLLQRIANRRPTYLVAIVIDLQAHSIKSLVEAGELSWKVSKVSNTTHYALYTSIPLQHNTHEGKREVALLILPYQGWLVEVQVNHQQSLSNSCHIAGPSAAWGWYPSGVSCRPGTSAWTPSSKWASSAKLQTGYLYKGLLVDATFADP